MTGLGAGLALALVCSFIVTLVVAELVCSFIATLAIVAFFKVYVWPHGMRGYNFWGWYRTVGWSNIVAATPVNLFALRYLRIYSGEDEGPLWLPLFLEDKHRFRALVYQYAGEDNPLSRALEAEAA
jgi:hypothetical protein